MFSYYQELLKAEAKASKLKNQLVDILNPFLDEFRKHARKETYSYGYVGSLWGCYADIIDFHQHCIEVELRDCDDSAYVDAIYIQVSGLDDIKNNPVGIAKQYADQYNANQKILRQKEIDSKLKQEREDKERRIQRLQQELNKLNKE